jgi:N-hydroxyarylamine O-acetyltransferase
MPVDLPSYFARIGYTGTGEMTLATLRELQLCHLSRIPFESLDPFLGIPVDIEPAAVQEKLVGGGRGGYCHEQNSLFHDVLAELGFSVAALGGRVVLTPEGKPGPLTLTHRLTLVELTEGYFIADVGFGGRTPTVPLRLEPELEQPTPFGAYRLTQTDDSFDLETKFNDRWTPLYRFNLVPQTRADFEVANWFTSTHPRSQFTQNLVVCRVMGNTRGNLLNAMLSLRSTDGSTEQKRLGSARELAEVMEETMMLKLPVPAETIWARLQK